ncbi:hypothetical protein [Streptomyces sp. Ru62]|uniref:hypothetical protein n=1 Tax=Streptomyces sp. Ru62 TaxID=2080745 RepID=UPI0011AFEF95|nr:hypothetical protein [Streptomyces sp. Ru62]
MRRLAGLLIALIAVLGLTLTGAQSAVADGPIAGGADIACEIAGGGVIGDVIGSVTGGDDPGVCEIVGHEVEKRIHQAWKAVWDSILGDVINSAKDVVKWVIKKVLTVALQGPSIDLAGTGLFGSQATLAGMLTWLGLVIATFGAMWQIGKMAVTGQSRHIGRAMLGWVESTLFSAVGVGLIAVLVTAGDAMTNGLVDATFKDDGDAYEKIVNTLVPNGVSNPITMLCIVAILLLVGFVQLIMIFLRQSAIPIQCLLLPVAGGGRTGGETTRQWAPRLVTSICVVIAYKPMLAIIICAGFSEFGHSHTLAEWLRGCATLILAVLAPGPLTKLFAPFGEAVGTGLASGGIGGAFASAGTFLAGRMGTERESGEGAGPATPMQHAQYVAQSMGGQGGQGGSGDAGEDGGQGSDAQLQATRNASGSRVPGQSTGDPAVTGTNGSNAATPSGQTPGVATGAGRPVAGGAVAIQVLDGINNGVQGAGGQIGNGGNSQ